MHAVHLLPEHCVQNGLAIVLQLEYWLLSVHWPDFEFRTYPISHIIHILLWKQYWQFGIEHGKLKHKLLLDAFIYLPIPKIKPGQHCVHCVLQGFK